MDGLTDDNKDALEKVRMIQEVFQNTFGGESGKQALKILENNYYIHRPNFTSSPNEHAYNEGQRSVVLYIKHMMGMSIEKLQEELSNAKG